MINSNKLYSGLFSIFLIYVIMTSFELIFFIFIVCPVITNNIRALIDSYKSKNELVINFDPNPVIIAKVLNSREYRLINDFNFNNYLIIIILIFLLISLLFYLYVKVGIIERTEHTEVSPNITPRSSYDSGSLVGSSLDPLPSYQASGMSLNSNMTRSSSIKFIYLKHAIYCALSTIVCLIVYQIFFYNYGLEFKYIGTENEMIVLFIESIMN
jgi:hypothetical protein